MKDRFQGWWERFTNDFTFHWPLRRNKRLGDPFSTKGGFSEKQGGGRDTPDFSQILRINEHDLRLQIDGQQAAMSESNEAGSSAPIVGGLGLSFNSGSPFADPPPPVQSKAPATKGNPFVDLATHPESASQNDNTYIADVRRSRGQANVPKNDQSTLRSSSIGRPNSRYPSTIALNRDSYRDTVYSSMSINGRRGKGRSDPFDLERLELWMSSSSINTTAVAPSAGQSNAKSSNRPGGRGNSTIFPDPLRMSAVQGNLPGTTGRHMRQPSIAHSRTISSELGSIYSSGVSSLAGWGGPGPDLGPGSSSTSLHGNARSNGDSQHLSSEAVYPQGAGVIKGSLTEMDLSLSTDRDVHSVSPLSPSADWDARRTVDNHSPVSVRSILSGKKGVGQAM